MRKLTSLREQAVRLRLEERLSLKEIRTRLEVSQGSLSNWLRELPLTEQERRAKWREKAIGRPSPRKHRQGEASKFYRMVDPKSLTPQRKSKVAEVAVLFRLTLHGYNSYGSVFDGDKTDLLVIEESTGRVLKVEVRCVRKNRYGRPSIHLRCSCGRGNHRRLTDREFDILVGYDLRTDIAYVFTAEEIKQCKTMVSTREDCAERWDKLTAS